MTKAVDSIENNETSCWAATDAAQIGRTATVHVQTKKSRIDPSDDEYRKFSGTIKQVDHSPRADDMNLPVLKVKCGDTTICVLNKGTVSRGDVWIETTEGKQRGWLREASIGT